MRLNELKLLKRGIVVEENVMTATIVFFCLAGNYTWRGLSQMIPRNRNARVVGVGKIHFDLGSPCAVELCGFYDLDEMEVRGNWQDEDLFGSHKMHDGWFEHVKVAIVHDKG
ncbi:MAG: hypothetical protein A2402_01080 [Candidatus Staskawiczbacteria bacterium RIFOXYC1_FULL_37_43]|nr:MAG: hypothetical protein A2813_00475 [Candidatus Staskawiczbacteria bacterium RIFCSPHIGHO2_01_FULL_37_17]OGZ71333.1 MAG: hypothetical protein A2891_02980 [Candidatus Staskawiczbacteria bacterium RIFCSPLOWO2_01_FULL_37_19]OGZ75908.1 MAG: hypothetical protein A2205_02180 [Candidatus Staskawiczbacteria bacterium RIFOXYA1_FULL_37_15]OGZ77583.1 MAG: hypothetical protein A2280_00560 [Candidatus Staskawiczbacteria bacterium RIFOXYA12_FULL_37_10]OGZ80796.1 MAG: hypothetical protein A2353_00980 [Can